MNLKQILKLPTPRLLVYYKKHYRGPNPHIDRYGYGGTWYDKDKEAAWERSKEAIRNELNFREHVE